MTLTVTITTTKPAGTQFYSGSDADATTSVKELISWTASQPGFISQNYNVSENTIITTIVWDSVDNYINWANARRALPSHQARVAYNHSQGIVSTVTEIIN